MPTGHLPSRMSGTSARDLMVEGDTIMKRADALDVASYEKLRNKKYFGSVKDGVSALGNRIRGSARYSVASMKVAFGDNSSGNRQFYDFGSAVTSGSHAQTGSNVGAIQGSTAAHGPNTGSIEPALPPAAPIGGAGMPTSSNTGIAQTSTSSIVPQEPAIHV
jgi:hypothetical protein